MAQLQLDYSAHEGSQLFDTTDPYSDGEQRWAARGEWYIRFLGYVFKAVSSAAVPTAGAGLRIMFFNTLTSKLTVKDSAGVLTTFPTEDETKQYSLLMS